MELSTQFRKIQYDLSLQVLEEKETNILKSLLCARTLLMLHLCYFYFIIAKTFRGNIIPILQMKSEI